MKTTDCMIDFCYGGLRVEIASFDLPKEKSASFFWKFSFCFEIQDLSVNTTGFIKK